MKILLRILTISLLITVFSQSVYAMTLENIASLNSTFDVNFTEKQIGSLSKNDRSELEVIAKKLYLVSPQREIDRIEALKVIRKTAEALTPTDPLLYGIETALESLAGKAGTVVTIAEIGQAAGLAYVLYKILEENYNMIAGGAANFTTVYIGERNKGKSHEEVWGEWFPFYTGIYKKNANPRLEEKVKNTFEAYQLTLKGEEWEAVKETVILPIFERAKKNDEQQGGFFSNLWKKIVNLFTKNDKNTDPGFFSNLWQTISNSVRNAAVSVKEFFVNIVSQKKDTTIQPSDLSGQISNTIPDEQADAKPTNPNPFQDFYDFYPKDSESQKCIKSILGSKFIPFYNGNSIPTEEDLKPIHRCLGGDESQFDFLPTAVQQCFKDVLGKNFDKPFTDHSFQIGPEAEKQIELCPAFQEFNAKINAFEKYILSNQQSNIPAPIQQAPQNQQPTQQTPQPQTLPEPTKAPFSAIENRLRPNSSDYGYYYVLVGVWNCGNCIGPTKGIFQDKESAEKLARELSSNFLGIFEQHTIGFDENYRPEAIEAMLLLAQEKGLIPRVSIKEGYYDKNGKFWSSDLWNNPIQAIRNVPWSAIVHRNSLEFPNKYTWYVTFGVYGRGDCFDTWWSDDSDTYSREKAEMDVNTISGVFLGEFTQYVQDLNKPQGYAPQIIMLEIAQQKQLIPYADFNKESIRMTTEDGHYCYQ